MSNAEVTRYRCWNKCLIAEDRLIGLRANPTQPWTFVATGPCPNCGTFGTVSYGDHSPAGAITSYAKVGVKVQMSTAKCANNCIGAKSLICKCSCGGARHGVAA